MVKKIKIQLRYKNKILYLIYLWYVDKIKYRNKITYWDWKKKYGRKD